MGFSKSPRGPCVVAHEAGFTHTMAMIEHFSAFALGRGPLPLA